jgi:mono/diheme cytochrome c family protein
MHPKNPILLVPLLLGVAAQSILAADKDIDFNKQIRPILSENCFACHGPDDDARQAELRLDREESIFGDPERTIIRRGKPGQSELVRRITSHDPDEQMPPADSNKSLTREQVQLLTRWIKQGARYQRHWSLMAPVRAEPPSSGKSQWPRNDVDRFILARLKKEGLQPSPVASRETLLRRLSLDLSGLPPTLAEIDDFLNDSADDAYQRVVERLLKSPRFGEHMAWSWLEAARYSDTNGYQGDRTRTMSFWRTWVIRAFNDNMPFDKFTIDQLAGDLLEDPTLDQLVASGFNRNHPLNGEGGRIAEENRVEYVFDRTETTSTVWMGLTVGCARCHDHKFDPITQREYFQLYSYFNHIDESGSVDAGGNANPVMNVPTLEQWQRIKQLEKEITDNETRKGQPEIELAESRQDWINRLQGQLKDQGKLQGWSVLQPAAVISSGGATVAIEPSGAVLITGSFAKKDDYTVTVKPVAGSLAAIQLEALTTDQLKYQGPGRKANFVLTSFELSITSPGGEAVKLPLARAIADFNQDGLNVSATLDPSAEQGWGIWDGEINTAQDRKAIFFLETPVEMAAGSELTIVLRHQSKHDEHNLGHFRLSVSSDPKVDLLAPSAPSTAIVTILRTPVESWTEKQATEVSHYHRAQTEQYQEAQRQVTLRRAELDRISDKYASTMVMRDREKPRETYMLTVGRYDAPRKDEGLIHPDVPASLPPLPESAPANRLALARWLVSGQHPLTARVAVNRLWQGIFGSGLVRTSEDFGSQGELPSHPALLDWLACEYLKGGWDTKAMIRLMVNSATYRQQSRVSPELLAKDPFNRLLARGSRYRLPSHVIRDQALAVAGLLKEKVGGPSVKPYQPAGLWADFSFGKITYKADSGENLYRRSLYTFWRRSLGPPNMFDEANRQVCTVRFSRTNTPLHALVLLNDVTFVEAARVFAERILVNHQTSEDRLATAFRMTTSRRPGKEEIVILNRLLDRSLTYYREHPDQATEFLQSGESPLAEGLDRVDLAAYANVFSMLLNTDEAITRE